MNKFCHGEEDNPVKLEVIRRDLGNRVLCETVVTLAEIRENPTLEKNIDNGKFRGKMKILDFIYAQKPTFLDYVYGGCEVSLIIGIDFTKSNGTQNSIKSLHHLSDDRPNEYLQAIRAVGEVLQYYDSDKKIPVFGFGARLPPHQSVVSHCFALNGNIFSPEVDGIDEVIKSYEKTLSEIALHGPTAFSQLISEIIKYASATKTTQSEQKYYILLILTDGAISDIETTTSLIIKASELPISIVIVGVGDDEFQSMEVLDADENPLMNKKTGAVMKRDIVQFVPYAKFKDNPELLAKEVLYEIPNQLLNFMDEKEIKPNMPKKDNKGQIIGNKGRGLSIGSVDFLEKEKMKFVGKLEKLGFERWRIMRAIDNGIACKSIELAIEKMNLIGSENRKYFKDRKGKVCPNCQANKINSFNSDCCHLICCSLCIAEYTKCPTCKIPISNWKTAEN